jgi:hypothetical protein
MTRYLVLLLLGVLLVTAGAWLLCRAAFGAEWKPGVITTYAARFDGRRTASGEVFRHSGYTVACNALPLRTRVEIRYGRNGRAVVRVTDTGKLPLHRANRPQFDVSRAVARSLGLYSPKYGRTIRWRVLNGKQNTGMYSRRGHANARQRQRCTRVPAGIRLPLDTTRNAAVLPFLSGADNAGAGSRLRDVRVWHGVASERQQRALRALGWLLPRADSGAQGGKPAATKPGKQTSIKCRMKKESAAELANR